MREARRLRARSWARVGVAIEVLVLGVFGSGLMFGVGRAATCEGSPLASCEQWHAHYDGLTSADIPVDIGVSVTTNVVHQLLTFTTGTSVKPVSGDGDIGTVAYDAQSGAEVWRARYDDLLSEDSPVALAISHDNNYVFVAGTTTPRDTSDSDIIVIAYAMDDGEEGWVTRIETGAGVSESAADLDITTAGGWLAVTGRAGSSMVTSVLNPGTGAVDWTIVGPSGEGNAVAVTQKHVYVAGEFSEFGNGGDLGVVAYITRTSVVSGVTGGDEVWRDSYGSAALLADRGIDIKYHTQSVVGANASVYVTGESFTGSTSTGFDVVTIGYSGETGVRKWGAGDAGVRRIDVAGNDDRPAAIAAAPDGSAVYVAATAERFIPTGDSVLVARYDASSGSQTSTLIDGAVSNADDAAADILVRMDNRRVYVGATIVEAGAPGAQIALIALDPMLALSWIRTHGVDGTDEAVGVAVSTESLPDSVFEVGRTTGQGVDYDTVSFDTSIPAASPSPTGSESPSSTPTESASPSPDPTESVSPSPSPDPTGSVTPTPDPTGSVDPSPTAVVSPDPSNPPPPVSDGGGGSASGSETPTPRPTASSSPGTIPQATAPPPAPGSTPPPAPSESAAPSPRPTPTPSNSPSATPTEEPPTDGTDPGPPDTVAPCRSFSAIKGTRGNDRLRGTPEDDIICALGGDDVVEPSGGDDLIYLGGGDDTARGGRGRDSIFGQGGADVLFGGKGRDSLKGGAGGDRVKGGPGSDSLRGGKGDDRLRGSEDDARIDGGAGEDTCTPPGARMRRC